MHIYDDRFPAEPTAKLRPANASVDDYRALQRRLGTRRTIVVQPSTYGLDNRCTLAALAAFGDDARAVVALDSSVGEAEIERLDRLGVRGIRFNLALGCAPGIDELEPLSARIAAHGWHAEINLRSHQMIALEPLLASLPGTVVFDHLGHVQQPEGIAHPSFAALVRLVQGGRTWVKISGAYIDSRCGPPDYSDVGTVARALISVAPERLVWGSDWPHPSAPAKPDAERLFALLCEWSGNASTARRILIDNPRELYRFAALSVVDRAQEVQRS